MMIILAGWQRYGTAHLLKIKQYYTCGNVWVGVVWPKEMVGFYNI
jgi:hypothetical protein